MLAKNLVFKELWAGHKVTGLRSTIWMAGGTLQTVAHSTSKCGRAGCPGPWHVRSAPWKVSRSQDMRQVPAVPCSCPTELLLNTPEKHTQRSKKNLAGQKKIVFHCHSWKGLS